jgi:hypothetical protein
MRLPILFLFTLISLNTYAQTDTVSQGKFNVYGKLGIQVGGPLYKSASIVEKKGSTGFNPILGVGFTYVLFKKKNSLSFSLEAFYSRRKINYNSTVVDQYYVDQQTIYISGNPYVFDVETTFSGNSKGTFDMKYIEIPLLIQYGIKRKWSFQGGAYFSWAYSRKNTGTATGIVGRTDIPNPSTIENKEYDNSQHLNSHYWGAVLGTQYAISPKVKVDFRLTYSFKSLYEESWKAIDYTLRDLYLQLSVDYLLFQTKK